VTVEEKICAYEPCSLPFIARTHNQIYHSDACTKLATNERIMAKYYETKARKKGAVRICKTPGCQTRLSRYNPESICSKCESEQKESQRQRMINILKDN
jgi:hypothetical protein